MLENGEPHPDDFPCQVIGLAIDSNSGKGGPDRDGCAAVIFAVTMPGLLRGSLEGARVVLLDWDIQSLAQGGVAPWLQRMRDLTMAWFKRLKPLNGPPAAYVEPAGNGYAIIEAARVQGLNPREIDTKFVAFGKDNRALAVEPHATAGRVKIGRSALEKRIELPRRHGQPPDQASHRIQSFRQGRLSPRRRLVRRGDVLGAGVFGRRDRDALVKAQAGRVTG